MTPREWRRKIAELAKEFDRVVEHAGSGHLKLACSKEKRPLVRCAATASDYRAIKNVRARLRRAEISL